MVVAQETAGFLEGKKKKNPNPKPRIHFFSTYLEREGRVNNSTNLT